MTHFEAHIQGKTPVVVDFSAEWCGPCKLMPAVLEQVKEQAGDRVIILKVDIDKYPQYTELYGIQSVPTLMIFKEGNVIWRKNGLSSAHEILEKLPMLIE